MGKVFGHLKHSELLTSTTTKNNTFCSFEPFNFNSEKPESVFSPKVLTSDSKSENFLAFFLQFRCKLSIFPGVAF